MNITLPPAVEQTLTPEAAALHLAIGLFVSEEASLGQAADIAGMSPANFLVELGTRRISPHYGREEFAQDVATIERLSVLLDR